MGSNVYQRDGDRLRFTDERDRKETTAVSMSAFHYREIFFNFQKDSMFDKVKNFSEYTEDIFVKNLERLDKLIKINGERGLCEKITTSFSISLKYKEKIRELAYKLQISVSEFIRLSIILHLLKDEPITPVKEIEQTNPTEKELFKKYKIIKKYRGNGNTY